MLKLYGYIGLALIVFAEINFFAKVEPFATWYIPIVWYGFILFVDSLVYRIKKRSIISNYPKEFLFMMALSVLFWLIFEFYNLYTISWIYVNYIWYLHLIDFTTILPAVLETFSLFNTLNIGKRFDVIKKVKNENKFLNNKARLNLIKLLAVIGAFTLFLPLIFPVFGFPFVWIGLFLFLDPFNYLIGRPSIVYKVSMGKKSILIRLFLSGIVMGFFWEFWNYQAYPKWIYRLPTFVPTIKLFAMPLLGYLGYLPFAVEALLFYAIFRSFIFKTSNGLLSI